MPGPVFSEGDRVSLRVVSEEDHAFVQRHWNDPAVRPGFGWASPVTPSDAADRVESFSSADDRETFLICADGERAGEAFLFDLDEHHGRVQMGYWIAPESQGEGYATDAARLLVRHAFEERRLHKAIARVLAFNDASRRVLEKLGFEHEGRQRDEFFVGGEYVDADRYGLLADEWHRA